MKKTILKFIIWLLLAVYLGFTNFLYFSMNIFDLNNPRDFVMGITGSIFLSLFLFLIFKIIYKTKRFKNDPETKGNWQKYGIIGSYLGAGYSLVSFIIVLFSGNQDYALTSNATIIIAISFFMANK